MTEQKGPGRPRKISSPEEFDRLVDEYLDICEREEKPVTWTGIALHLGFTSRHALDEYKNYPGFSASVKRAKLIVENAYEQRMYSHNPTGAIFVLKNMGWTDKQITELTGKDGGAIEMSDTDRAARIASLVERAREREKKPH